MVRARAIRWQLGEAGKVLPQLFSSEISDEVLAQAWSNNSEARFAELSENDDPAYRSLTNFVLSQLSEIKSGSLHILDAGSGLGFLSESLAREGHIVVSVEPSTRSFERAQDTFGQQSRVQFINDTVEHYAAGDAEAGKFDAVVANMTLHTVNRLTDFLRACRVMLKEDGVILATIPNPKAYLQSRSDLDISSIDLSIEQRLLIPFRIKNHETHPSPTPFIHRPFREYSLAAEAAGLCIDDYDVPAHIGPGRPNDIAFVVFRRRT